LKNRTIYKNIKIILLCCSFFICKHSFAQNEGRLTGKIYDKNVPLEFVTVVAYKSADTNKVLQHTTSDSLGRFSFSNLAFGNYQLKFSLIGYQTMIKNMSVNKSVLFLDSIQLFNKLKQLNSVTITCLHNPVARLLIY
jgi:5-hydroxyisourate hydrolase-like protein (transthyretin family)